ncbi:hypothetical protein JVU11DRAFT_78 [Chiua virens]|nr:hypothetical protein JVU11DRAFT_78 [Chiua virens]
MALDIFQQVFSFAMLADLVNDRRGTLKELQQDFQKQLTPYIHSMDGWQLAWGPTVWKFKPDEIACLANSWYIVYHPNAQFEDGSVHPTYVIAIAGTPLKCDDVLRKEDNAVDTAVNFNAWVIGGIKHEPVTIPSKNVFPGIPYFAEGTAYATYNLLNTASSEDAISPGNTIVDFLNSLDRSPSTRFIITGHSLGGCLTTSVALTLVTARVFHPDGNTLAYPIAGPSAGNVGWADLFAEYFPPRKFPGARSYQGWNLNLVNNLDVVPQIWCQIKDVSPQQWLGRILAVYGTPVVDDVWRCVVKYATSALCSGVVYKPVPSQYFDPPAPKSIPTTMEEYVKEALTQHCVSYLNELQITAAQVGIGPKGEAYVEIPCCRWVAAGD